MCACTEPVKTGIGAVCVDTEPVKTGIGAVCVEYGRSKWPIRC